MSRQIWAFIMLSFKPDPQVIPRLETVDIKIFKVQCFCLLKLHSSLNLITAAVYGQNDFGSTSITIWTVVLSYKQFYKMFHVL